MVCGYIQDMAEANSYPLMSDLKNGQIMDVFSDCGGGGRSSDMLETLEGCPLTQGDETSYQCYYHSNHRAPGHLQPLHKISLADSTIPAFRRTLD
jgi:hypothetical protein